MSAKPTARIYMPAKSAMQSGQGRSQSWALEFEPAERKRIDPLTGWVGSGDTSGQLRLFFDTREQAVAYAEARGLAYEVAEPAPVVAKLKPKSYAENFRFGRSENWTH